MGDGSRASNTLARLVIAAQTMQYLAEMELRLHRVPIRLQRAPIANHRIDGAPGQLVCVAAGKPLAVVRVEHQR